MRDVVLPGNSTAVIVLNYNGWHDTVACLASLLEVDEDIGIIVVDNASSDDSDQQIVRWSKEELPTLNARRAVAGRAHMSFRRINATEIEVDGPCDAKSSFGSITLIR